MGNTTTAEEFYTTGTYLEKNPLWHTEESPWKAEPVMRMLNRQKIVPLDVIEHLEDYYSFLWNIRERAQLACGTRRLRHTVNWCTVSHRLYIHLQQQLFLLSN